MSQHDDLLSRYQFALYSGSERLGLSDTPGPPVALFADQQMAWAHGRKLYGQWAEVRRVARPIDE